MLARCKIAVKCKKETLKCSDRYHLLLETLKAIHHFITHVSSCSFQSVSDKEETL